MKLSELTTQGKKIHLRSLCIQNVHNILFKMFT